MLVAFLLLAWLFGALTSPYLFKPAATLLLLCTSAVFYFTVEYGIAIDSEMIRNVFETNQAEAADLLTGKLFAYVILLGVLPAALLWASRIDYRPLSRDVWFKAKATAVVALIIAACSLPFTQNFTSVFREHRGLLYAFAPLNYLSATADYGRRRLRAATAETQPFGTDARAGTAWAGRRDRSLTVLVIGETARAANFSLNGYERETNPLLAKVPGLISFSRSDVLWNLHRAVAALHVLRLGACRYSRAARRSAGRTAAHSSARGCFRVVAGEPGWLCGCVQGNPDRDDGAGRQPQAVRDRRVPR